MDRTARDALAEWAAHRLRGGVRPSEAFTVTDARKALPAWSRSQLWRAIVGLVSDGQLTARRRDGKTTEYLPSPAMRRRARRSA